MNVKALKMIFLCCFLVVLAGCGTINSDIEIDNDFKGKWEATVDIGGEKSKEEIEQIFEKTLQTTAVNEEGKLLKETGEAEEIKAYADEFIKLEPLDAKGKVISSKDDSVKSSTWRVTAIFQNEKELLNAYRIIYAGSKNDRPWNVIFPYGDSTEQYMFYMGKSLGETTITVPGDINKEMSNAAEISGSTITFSEGEEVRFVFSKGTPIFRNVAIFVAIIGLTAVGIVIYKWRGKKHAQ